jgi:NAD(P)-dependent dehydrogenase (short-subunit alcohol dehydrogenase family)
VFLNVGGIVGLENPVGLMHMPLRCAKHADKSGALMPIRRRFTEKVVWITGGGSGIGRSLALRFAAEGATVVVSGRRADRLLEVVRECEQQGADAHAVLCDVTCEDSVRAAVAEVLKRCWRLDVVVANAGFSVAGRIEDISAEEWRRQLDTNVVGAAVTARHAIPELRKTGGRLVLVGSVASMVCAPGAGPYHASKYALRAIGQTLAMELHGSGVSVTTIHPGFVESEIAQVDNAGHFRADRDDKRPAWLMWNSERAARTMVDAISKRKRDYVFTGHGKVAAWLGRHAPSFVHTVITRAGIDYKRDP